VVDHSATPLPPAVCRLLSPAHTTPPHLAFLSTLWARHPAKSPASSPSTTKTHLLSTQICHQVTITNRANTSQT
jgi:hypothetical protein